MSSYSVTGALRRSLRRGVALRTPTAPSPNGTELVVRFAEGSMLRHALIAELFTGGYRNEVERATVGKVAGLLMRRVVA